MEKMQLGKTGLTPSRCGFGALPIQRTPMDEAVRILRKAFDNGIDFFDTARAYSDSEEKLGNALHGVRKQIVIATKSTATSRKEVLEHLAVSLGMLKTDYIDILQLHNPKTLPDPADGEGSFAALVEAKQKGMVRFIGITNHSRELAVAAARSGIYDTVQFPLSTLSSEEDLSLIDICRKNNVGLIAMKALSGGLITDIPSAHAFFRQFGNVIPIWGIQREKELDQFLELEAHPRNLTPDLVAAIETDRRELSGKFCRGCGYCMPCPAGINIPWSARMSLLLRRAPFQQFLTEDWQQSMERIHDCTECGNCRSKCPYKLDTPELLKANLKDYERFALEHRVTVMR
jgi:aryl-alcohol dehydrogenase-like predicted oxidoreductase